ncbi:sensor histidine kinase [Pedobacter faecalis]|uniref:sensor histidine kinase n=1 Tax=Pedobacter faecalis TaxID=3041495 RepID=UPI0025519E49|nr:ATP-binding protein [Pedobacter sp. ELA7]
MTLKTKYIFFIGFLHLLLLALSYLAFKDDKPLFLAIEFIVICAAVVAIRLYQQLLSPLQLIKEGINAIRDQDFNVRFVPTGKREVDELIEVYNQMMDALREERTKQKAQHFFLQKLIHTSPTGIIILDFDQQIKTINPKAALILAEDQNAFIRCIMTMKAGESRMLKVGSIKTYKIQKSNFIDRGFSRFFVMIEELTAEIAEAEKSTYTKVIRMMAHEVNNTVGAVNSIIGQVLVDERFWQDQPPALRKALRIASERNENLNIFMRNFAELAKLSPANKQQVDLCRLMENVISLMQVFAERAQVRFTSDLPSSAYFIHADAQQIEQVLLNITKNAIEAVDGSGLVHFRLDATAHILSISDSGQGIPAGVQDQLFNPFFSTKKDGQGVGLTLVREILLSHGFDFSLGSQQFSDEREQLQTSFVIKLKP